ncbi:MAG: hypothetical protein P8N02_16915 [Actinomycetota bacterium]|nr:hypothetical protein [Actinomycetota bacterium]
MVSRCLSVICAGLLLLAAACGDADSPADGGTDTAEQSPSTTIQAPLLPQLRQAGSGGIGRIEEWVETWNVVNEALQGESAEFPLIALATDDFTVRGAEDGFPVFTAEIGELILGGVVAAEDGGITSLIMVGQPQDPDFLAAYSIWLGTLDPTVDPMLLLSPELAFGDEQRSVVESNGRTYEAFKVDGGPGTAVSVSMVAGSDVDDQVTFSAHSVVRRNVLGALAAETDR